MNHSESCEQLSNMYLEFNVIQGEKLAMINNCKSMPKFYLTVVDFKLLDDFTSYRVELGIYNDNLKNIHIIQYRVRYSQLLRLYTNIKPMLILNRTNVEFPPKVWFGNNNNTLANYRSKEFNKLFKALVLTPGILSHPEFMKLFPITDN